MPQALRTSPISHLLSKNTVQFAPAQVRSVATAGGTVPEHVAACGPGATVAAGPPQQPAANSGERDFRKNQYVWRLGNAAPLPAKLPNEKTLIFDTYERFLPQQ